MNYFIITISLCKIKIANYKGDRWNIFLTWLIVLISKYLIMLYKKREPNKKYIIQLNWILQVGGWRKLCEYAIWINIFGCGFNGN